jgi:hypothetical protein
MNPLTIAEIRLRHAQLAEQAERARQRGRAVSATGTQAMSLARQARLCQERADDYAALLQLAKRPEVER